MRLAFALVLCAACAARTEIRDTPLDAGSSAADAAHVARDYKVAYQASGGGGPIWVWHSRDASIEEWMPTAEMIGMFTYDGRFMPLVHEAQIDVVDAHGLLVRSQTTPPTACGPVHWASPRPDAARLMVSAWGNAETACFGTFDADGAYVQLGENQYATMPPRYAPDGKTVVFNDVALQGKVLVSDIVLMNDDGSNRVVLGRGGAPSFSFDGKRITCLDEQSRIVVMDLTSQETSIAVDTPDAWASGNSSPFFTPDGDAIVFQALSHSIPSLRRVDLTTHETATLIEPFGAEGYLTGATMTLALDEP